MTTELARAIRDPAAPSIEDYLFEAVGYRDSQTVRHRSEVLSALTGKAQATKGQRHWEPGELRVAELASRVLGRLRLPEATPPLIAWARAVQNPELRAIALIALVDSRQPGVSKAVRELVVGTRVEHQGLMRALRRLAR